MPIPAALMNMIKSVASTEEQAIAFVAAIAFAGIAALGLLLLLLITVTVGLIVIF